MTDKSANDQRPIILVTNDDGIDSHGLHAVVECLSKIGTVSVIAPDQNRSGVSRSITLGQVLTVKEHILEGAEVAFATSGTPTDCVRLAALGLAGPLPDLVVSGSNKGLNVGDDIAYSGTVSAAFDAAFNGLPAIAVSQQSTMRELGYPRDAEFDYSAMKRFLPSFVQRVLDQREMLPRGLVLNVNVPGVPFEELTGVEVGLPGRRIYRDKLELQQEADGLRYFALYGDDPMHHADDEGTDIAAIGRGAIAVTPLRFDVADYVSVEAVDNWRLNDILKA